MEFCARTEHGCAANDADVAAFWRPVLFVKLDMFVFQFVRSKNSRCALHTFVISLVIALADKVGETVHIYLYINGSIDS